MRYLYISGLGILIILIVLYLFDLIDVAQAIQIILTFALVSVTAVYVRRTGDIANGTKKQAEASMKMAEEMKEQRIMTSRPIIVQRARERAYDSDDFEIFNIGNGPAIELEIMVLDNNKMQKYFQRHTFFIQDPEKPIEFPPLSLETYNSFLDTICYLVSQYRSVDTKQIWYQTWLPFIPKISQSGDRIIITAQELEFREVNKKESF
jgi:hypothetical protein